jgi:hypothetical protein
MQGRCEGDRSLFRFEVIWLLFRPQYVGDSMIWLRRVDRNVAEGALERRIVVA